MSEVIHREMMRCKVDGCRRTWSVHPYDLVDRPTCACGGELEPFDWEAHKKTLPHVPYDPANDPPPNLKKK